MSVILICLLASLFVAVGFLAAFVWAVKSGQYDDTITPSMRVVGDEDQDDARDGESIESKK